MASSSWIKGWIYMSLVMLVVLMTIYHDAVEGCTCLPQHPQTAFCGADFVIKAKVKSRKAVSTKVLKENGRSDRWPETRFKITINKVLKENELFRNVSHRYLYSPEGGGLCEAMLEPNKKYLLTGHIRSNKLYTTLCDFKHEWSNMPVRMRKGFNFQFEKNCDCTIVSEWTRPNKQGDKRKSCKAPRWREDPRHCYEDHALCKLYPDNDGEGKNGGKCKWTKPRVWKDCWEKRENDVLNEKLNP